MRTAAIAAGRARVPEVTNQVLGLGTGRAHHHVMIPRRRVDKGTQAVLDLWTELRVEDARAVASGGTPLHLADGTLLTQAGTVGREAFLLLTGTCVVMLDGGAVT